VHIEPHILIVDDDLQIRKLLGRYLAEQGFRVTLASDKRTLNAALESNDIKLIVLDVMLPDGSGLEICREMRAAYSDYSSHRVERGRRPHHRSRDRRR
jgi:two-component system OmpR family response regulator